MVYFDCFKSAVAIFHSDSAPIAAATAVVISAKDSSDIQQQQNGGGNRAAANQGVHNSRPAVVDFYDNQAQSSLAPLQQQMEGSGFTEALISNLGAGAIAGTVGTTITIPLEVVKTRMQSSQNLEQYRQPGRRGWMPWLILKSLWRSGGIRDCYKGLVPNLLGVTPANSIYFATYSSTKRLLNNYICRNDVDPAHDFPRSSRERANNAGGGQELFGWRPTRDSPLVHMCSAGVGALTAATFMNPIWVIRTRLQLHDGRLGFLECRRRIWRREGIRGFFRGVSGSYLGVFETMIQFSVYEWLRSIICDPDRKFLWFFETDKEHKAFYQFMIAGAMAKTCAVCVAYPHEVIRTRLREEGNTLNLRQTIMQICRHDGFKGFYRGLDAQLLRSVPNTAIIMLTYELVVTGLKHLH